MKRKIVKKPEGWIERKLANAAFRKGFEKELQALKRCDILNAFGTIEFRKGWDYKKDRREQDWESVVLQTDPKFWKLIRARRKQSTRSLATVRARLRHSK